MTDDTKQRMTDDEITQFKQTIKNQIIQEMKDEKTLAMEEAAQRRKQEDEERQKYFKIMKDSPEPWVEIISWVNTEQGVKVEMEWNDSFIDFLKTEGIKGTDEDQIIQKWVAMLLHNIADDMNYDASEDDSEFS